jgi:hypothetical protein
MLARILMEAFEDLGIHARHAVGGLAQTFALGIFADGEQDLPDRPSYSFEVNRTLFTSQNKPPSRALDDIRSAA